VDKQQKVGTRNKSPLNSMEESNAIMFKHIFSHMIPIDGLSYMSSNKGSLFFN
jgi:hypothetical protein